MTPLGILIEKDSWAVLRDEPLYSARFVAREGTDELLLVVRVEEVDWFLEASPPLTCRLTAWRSSRGVWVAAFSYRLHPCCGGPRGGVFYLNPRHATDAALLRALPRQESLSVILLSEDCGEHYTVTVPHPPQELARWQEEVTPLLQAHAGPPLQGEEDPDFAAAVHEFHSLTVSRSG
ncbi:MAG: hypothetical protein AB1671_16580 [Thermodesulfobacteriota bacterium]|jgi:hypothetical protein